MEEIRGIWLTNTDSNVLDSPDNIKTAIEKLKKLNFNTLYHVVWHRGFTLYPSSIAEKVIGVEVANQFRGRDILQEIINYAQPLEMRVIPWFEYGLMTPSNSPLTHNKPNWITQEKSGNKIMNGQCWLSPAHPEVQKFMTELIADVVNRYEIDGIQFDDHFGIPATMGFDAFIKQVYQKEKSKRSSFFIPNFYNLEKCKMSQLTNLLKQIVTEVKAINKNCIVSISPNPLNFSIKKFSADWQTWIEEKMIDELVLQVYRPTLSSFEGELIKAEVKKVRQQIPTVIGILTGLKPEQKRVEMSLIQAQVEKVRERNFAGFSYFFYESLLDLIPSTENKNERELAFQNLLSVNLKPRT